jgi:hypothetical protein
LGGWQILLKPSEEIVEDGYSGSDFEKAVNNVGANEPGAPSDQDSLAR